MDRVFADAPLLVRGAGPEDVRPLRPGVVGLAVLGRLGVDLELVDAPGPLAVDRPQAVGAGVAAADDDDVLVPGREEFSSGIESPATRLFCGVR